MKHQKIYELTLFIRPPYETEKGWAKVDTKFRSKRGALKYLSGLLDTGEDVPYYKIDKYYRLVGDGTITLSELKKLAVKKIKINRLAIKLKLESLGAANIASLQADQFKEFDTFLRSIKAPSEKSRAKSKAGTFEAQQKIEELASFLSTDIVFKNKLVTKIANVIDTAYPSEFNAGVSNAIANTVVNDFVENPENY